MPTTLPEAPIRSAVETAPREALHELQLRRLRTALARREVVAHVETLDDLRAVPFTVKADLRASYPLGMMTVPATSWCGCTPRPGRAAGRRWSATRAATSRSGPS